MGFANEMDYYSGMMFKIYSDKAAKAVINGGRYDELAKRFAGVTSACGFGADMDIIASIYDLSIGEENNVVTITSPPSVHKYVIAIAELLRQSGYKINVINGNELSYEYMGTKKDGLPTEYDLMELKNAKQK